MDNSACDILLELIRHHGVCLCDDYKGCDKAFLELRLEYEREANILLLAHQSRIPADLLCEPKDQQQQPLIDKYANRLEHDYAICRRQAQWATQAWAFALGIVAEPMLKESEEEGGRPKVTRLGYGVVMALVTIASGAWVAYQFGVNQAANAPSVRQQTQLIEQLTSKHQQQLAQITKQFKQQRAALDTELAEIKTSHRVLGVELANAREQAVQQASGDLPQQREPSEQRKALDRIQHLNRSLNEQLKQAQRNNRSLREARRQLNEELAAATTTNEQLTLDVAKARVDAGVLAKTLEELQGQEARLKALPGISAGYEIQNCRTKNKNNRYSCVRTIAFRFSHLDSEHDKVVLKVTDPQQNVLLNSDLPVDAGQAQVDMTVTNKTLITGRYQVVLLGQNHSELMSDSFNIYR